jgi:hypothetical protein
MAEIRYPWKIKVEYHTPEEYQEQLASVMNINEQGEHVSLMDHLYEKTKGDNGIMELCSLAAEKMLLTSDAEYGQIMMFSYDCFARFHILLQWYFASITGEMDALGEDADTFESKAIENREWIRQYFLGGYANSIPNSK